MPRIAMSLFLSIALYGLCQLPAEDLNIVFIPKSTDQVFWTFIRNGVDRAIAETSNIKLTWRGPAYNDDTDSQIQVLKHYTHPGIDAIIIVPTDRDRLLEPVRQAVAMGIKVLVIDSELAGDSHLAYVATDNVSAGGIAARQIAALLGNRGKVLVFRTVKGSASTDQRGDGFVATIQKIAPDIKLLGDEYGGGSTGKTYRTALEMLRKYPGVDAIFAVNESSAEGMLRALRETKLAGKIKFVGFDASEALLDGLRSREIQGLVLQDPEQMGYLGMKLAIAAARGEKLAKRMVYTDAVLLTLDNIDKPEIKALLVPK